MKRVFLLLLSSTSVLAAVPLSSNLECRGPGFDYAELDTKLGINRVDVRVSHFFFDLSQQLHALSLLPPTTYVRELRTNFKPEQCSALESNEKIRLCSASEGKVELIDADGTSYLVDVNYLTVATDRREAVEFLDNGFFGKVRLSPNASPVVIVEEMVLSHNVEAPDCKVH